MHSQGGREATPVPHTPVLEPRPGWVCLPLPCRVAKAIQDGQDLTYPSPLQEGVPPLAHSSPALVGPAQPQPLTAAHSRAGHYTAPNVFPHLGLPSFAPCPLSIAAFRGDLVFVAAQVNTTPSASPNPKPDPSSDPKPDPHPNPKPKHK